MQGRLVPPVGGRIQSFPRLNWADEFSRAAQAGLDCIEWIYDEFGADVNPIATDQGVDSILQLSAMSHVRVASLCADYLIDWPLVRAGAAEIEDRMTVLVWLIGRCRRMTIERIVLPFVDASRIDTRAEGQAVVKLLGRLLQPAEDAGVELHLETSLRPDQFADLLAHLPANLVKVNYDIGNSASLAYDPREEFAAYGDRVGSVHVKDRMRGGGTVQLGDGDADLPAVFDCLRALHYSGDFVLQVARGGAGDEVRSAEQNRALVRDYMTDARARDQ